jgi:hypothetical protein
MAGITLSQAQEQLDAHLEAVKQILGQQEVTVGDDKLRRASLIDVQAGVKFWDEQVTRLSMRANGRSRTRSIIPGW